MTIRFRSGVCVLLLALGAHGIAAGADQAWFDGARPGMQAQQAVELLAAASTHGLEPRDYDTDALRQSVLRASQDATLDAAAAAALDRRLTQAMERYLADLRRGRIDPTQLPHGYASPRRDDFDPASYLQAALAGKRLPRQHAMRHRAFHSTNGCAKPWRSTAGWLISPPGMRLCRPCRPVPAALRRSSNRTRPGSACRCCGNA
jgi:hypothetical protein